MNNASRLQLKETIETLFDKDIWTADDVGLKPDSVHSCYLLNFTPIQPTWLRQTSKQFIRFQAATKSYNTCRHYLLAITYFGEFITTCAPEITAQHLSRAVMLDYLAYLSQTHLHPTTKNMVMVSIRTFIEIVAHEQWLPFPRERIIFDTDIPQRARPIPRYIPEYVMTQLQTHLHTLPEYLQRLLFILQETGRRISEICTLRLDCLEQDKQQDYFLKINDNKMKKSYLIPITEQCAQCINQQRTHVFQAGKDYTGYLFPALRQTKKNAHLSARPVNETLNALAQEKNITDEQGNIWHFHAHQFRHTVGTRMINAGVSQAVVQKYLGHESPEMTSRYAHLHDQTLKKAFQQFQGTLITANGQQACSVNDSDRQWLKQNVLAQALPNGLCHLPLAQQRCPHANACLTCAHFCTHTSFLPQHEKQLKETQQLIDKAKSQGWQRQIEMNEAVKANLEKIIKTLKEPQHDA